MKRAPKPAEIGPVPQPTILVVDDDSDVRDMLAEAVVSFGYRCLVADSAHTALGLLEDGSPDLVLTDVHMPGLGGVEFCRRLKTDPRFQLMPVVLLTAIADLPARIAGLDAGADDFFAKPCDMVELRTRLRSLLRIKDLHDDLATKNRLLRALFGRYVSEDVAAEIIRHPDKHLALDGEKREVTILFGDLRGFTSLAETLDPSDVVRILNSYLSAIVEVVFERGGTLDKFHGDGIMALFGAPVEHNDDPGRAVRCALALQDRIPRLVIPGFPDLRLQMGIGINTGVVVAGNIGSERRMDYTVIGSEVNLAQRFEASAGPGQILVTGNTYARVQDEVQVRDLGPLRVKGLSTGVPAFDVLGLMPARAATPLNKGKSAPTVGRMIRAPRVSSRRLP
jgi:adenylate cyclase